MILLGVQCSIIDDSELFVVVDSVDDGRFNLNGRASAERNIDEERRSWRKYADNFSRRSRAERCWRWEWEVDKEPGADWAADDAPYAPNSRTGSFSSDKIA